jgi:hypothetical protein
MYASSALSQLAFSCHNRQFSLTHFLCNTATHHLFLQAALVCTLLSEQPSEVCETLVGKSEGKRPLQKLDEGGLVI